MTIFPAALDTPPTPTTTACFPSGAVAGIATLICITPTSAVGTPANCTGAAAPPIVTFTACIGAGNCATAVPAGGAAPVAIPGDTAPAPVTQSTPTPPRATVGVGTTAPVVSVNNPGATALTANFAVSGAPLLFDLGAADSFTT